MKNISSLKSLSINKYQPRTFSPLSSISSTKTLNLKLNINFSTKNLVNSKIFSFVSTKNIIPRSIPNLKKSHITGKKAIIINKKLNELLNINTFEKKSKIYNISILSKQQQLKLSKNKILLINLTSSITELAKILILARIQCLFI